MKDKINNPVRFFTFMVLLLLVTNATSFFIGLKQENNLNIIIKRVQAEIVQTDIALPPDLPTLDGGY